MNGLSEIRSGPQPHEHEEADDRVGLPSPPLLQIHDSDRGVPALNGLFGISLQKKVHKSRKLEHEEDEEDEITQPVCPPTPVLFLVVRAGVALQRVGWKNGFRLFLGAGIDLWAAPSLPPSPFLGHVSSTEVCVPRQEYEDGAYHCECQPVGYSHEFEFSHGPGRGCQP